MKQKQSGKLNIIVAVYGLEIVTEKIKALISKEKIESGTVILHKILLYYILLKYFFNV